MHIREAANESKILKILFYTKVLRARVVEFGLILALRNMDIQKL